MIDRASIVNVVVGVASLVVVFHTALVGGSGGGGGWVHRWLFGCR